MLGLPAVSRLVEILVGGPTAPWERLGLHFTDGCALIGSVRLRVATDDAPGLRSVGVLDGADGFVDGAPMHAPLSVDTSSATDHELDVRLIDHVVLMTPDLERTCALVTQTLGVALKRMREAGPVRQGFFRLGEVILELVQSPEVASGSARWWGLVVNVDDLHGVCERLGPEVIGSPRPAVQPGRSIAAVCAAVGLGVPVALMSM